MSRQQYLTRLALGRSAFEDGVSLQQQVPQPNTVGVQLYSSKGRPINPQTESFNAKLRKAQNEVLELVGVVEREDDMDCLEGFRPSISSEAFQSAFHREQDFGESLQLAIASTNLISHLWLDGILARISSGIYHPQQPMFDMLAEQWTVLRGSPAWRRAALLFPGICEVLAHCLIEIPLANAVKQIVGRLQTHVNSILLRRRSRRNAQVAISVLAGLVHVVIETAILPINFYARSQRLGLVPCIPIIPPLRVFRIFSLEFFQHPGWKGFALINMYFLPSVLGSIHRRVWRGTNENGIRNGGLLSRFYLSSLPDSEQLDPILDLTYAGSFGWFTYYTLSLQRWILRKLGVDPGKRWNESSAEMTYGRNVQGMEHAVYTGPAYRSTTLAEIPAKFITGALKAAFVRMLLLPWNGCTDRAVALVCSASSLPKPEFSLKLGDVHQPLGGGPIARLFQRVTARSAWMEAIQHTNHIALLLAFHGALDILVFAGVYGTTRAMGTVRFGWGSRRV